MVARGKIRNITGVSLAGKTTLIELFMARRQDLYRSVSLVTRPQRSTEVAGVHFRFCTKPEFEAMIKAGQLLEYVNVWGADYYGTPLAELETATASSKILLAQCEVRGIEQLLSHGLDVRSVFLNVPRAEQVRRYGQRPDSVTTLSQRLDESERERAHFRDLQKRYPERFLMIENSAPVEETYQVVERFLFS